MLESKLVDHSAKIGVVGLGYVGKPLAQAFHKEGFHVMGFDNVRSKLDACGDFLTYNSIKAIQYCDVIIICVGTPITKNKEPDISMIVQVANDISKYMKEGTLVVLESTTYPGTTEEVILPILEYNGMRVGMEFNLGYSPEREDIQRADFNVTNMPKVVSGVTSRCLYLTESLYSTITKTVPASSTRTAEMAKTFENSFRLVNISLVNELKILAQKMGIDMDEVVSITATRPFGYMPFNPGPGTGGHCVPVDPYYLTWKAKEFKSPTRLIEAAGLIDDSMPEYVVARTAEALNSKGKCLKGSNVLILGLTYKKNVSDDRGSVSYRIMDLLDDHRARVYCHDPYVEPINMYDTIKEVDAYVYNSMDVVVVVVDHDAYDYKCLTDHAHLIVDTRNLCDGNLTNVFKA
jgi:UDP-N-acetyl-D-glucosamine dehydrogenase